MEVAVFGLVLAVLSYFSSTVDALKCYQCQAVKETDICSTMERSFVTMRPTLCIEQNYDLKYTYCYKKITRDEDGNFKTIVRGCAYTQSDHTCALGTDYATWPKQPQCQVQSCKVEACNSANGKHSSLIVMVTLATLTYLIGHRH